MPDELNEQQPDLGEMDNQDVEAPEETETEDIGEETETEDVEESSEENPNEEEADETDGPGETEDEGFRQKPEADPQEVRQEIEKRLLRQDERLQDERQYLKDDWQDLERAHEDVEKQIQNPVPIDGKPGFLVDQKRFDQVIDDCLASNKPEYIQAARQAIRERKQYQESIQRLQPKLLKLDQKRNEQAIRDIEQIKQALIDISPEYEQELGNIDAALKEALEESPAKLDRFIWSGVRDKFRFIDRLLDESGIKQRVEKEIRQKTRPNLAMPGGAGKGRKSTPPATRSKKTFTRQEINKMSPEVYAKHEAEIDRALMEGRIK